jgi:hypothetical protein
VAWALVGVGCSKEEPIRVNAQVESQGEAPDPRAGQEDVPAQEDTPDEAEDMAEPDAVEPDTVEPVELPPVATSVETSLSLQQVQAGDPVQIHCQAMDEQGEPILWPEEEAPSPVVSVTPQASVGQGEDALSIVPTSAGQVSVTCSLPSLGLIDSSPATLEVLPGAVHTVITSLSHHQVGAGAEVTAECQGYDAWANPVPLPDAEIQTDAVGAGLTVEGSLLRTRRAGVFTVTCQAPGAQEVIADTLEVSPGPVANFNLALRPQQDVYQPGQVVQALATASDRFDNPIPGVPIELSVDPETTRFGPSRFRLEEEGTYTLTAQVVSGPEQEPGLQIERQLIVNGAGPLIHCEAPLHGAMIHHTPGQSLTFQGSVSDAHGVQAVTVNDQAAQLNPDGTFSADINADFGVNFVEIYATDAYGERSGRTCSFLAADQWVSGANDYLNDSVTLRLSQQGIDDGHRSGNNTINSLGDLLHVALNSSQLRNQIHSSLRDSNPLLPTYCAQDACVFGACVCLYRLGLRYNNLQLDGPNDVSLNLVNNGLRVQGTVRNLGLDVSVLGTTPVSGWVRASYVRVELTSDVSLDNGVPRVSLRRIDNVEVGDISTDIRGLLGWVVDLIVPLFEGIIRNQVRDQIRSFISGSFNDILNGTLSGLDISSLGTSIAIPTLDGGDLDLNFGLRFSTVQVNNSRALFGVGTRFTGPTRPGGDRGLGAPVPGGAVRLDPATGRAVAATVNYGVLNHALHTLWLAGMLELDLGGDTLGASEDASVRFSANLPPVLSVQGDKALLSVGAAQVVLQWPGFLDEPLTLEVGAQAEADISLRDGQELNFGQIEIRRLYLSSPDVALDPTTEAILEDLVRRLLQRVIDSSLNDALPALPIPSFAIPDSLSQYGLPRDTSLGLSDPSMNLGDTHVILESDFGTLNP